jgi:hypothetical protein
MVISIDAIENGAELDAAAVWFEPGTDVPAAEDWEANVPNGRGIFYGLALSCVLWAGLIIGIRTLIALVV